MNGIKQKIDPQRPQVNRIQYEWTSTVRVRYVKAAQRTTHNASTKIIYHRQSVLIRTFCSSVGSGYVSFSSFIAVFRFAGLSRFSFASLSRFSFASLSRFSFASLSLSACMVSSTRKNTREYYCKMK